MLSKLGKAEKEGAYRVNGKTTHKKIWAFSITVVLLAALAAFALSPTLALVRKGTERIVTVEKGTAIESVTGSGVARPERQFDLTAAAYAVQKRFVNEGQVVRAGSPLVELMKTGIVRAPFSGVVAWVGPEVRETNTQDNVVLRLIDPSPLYLSMALDQESAMRVRRGQRARVNFDGPEEKTYSGRVRNVYSNGRDFLVHIDLPTLSPKILVGMRANVAIVVSRKANVLLVPVDAVSDGKVTVKRGTKERKQEVRLGETFAGKAELLEGDLQAGDRLIVRRR